VPAPERTTLDAIVSAGRHILESDGLDGLTMQAVAGRVGVKAPSLYKRVRDREALIGLVATAVADELGARLESAAPTVPAMARAFRSFAHDQPEGFRLVMSTSADPAALERASAPVLIVARELAGEPHALDAARLVTAWAVGFLTMELAGAFQLGGDLDAAFDYGVRNLERALQPKDA
jgi:AcrR family transcriptional regulator